MKPKAIYQSTAWKYFSRYVLLFYSDGLYAKCFTSGEILQINTANCHCGHLIKTSDSFATAFEFTNVGVQSLRDNRYFSGRPDMMYKKLVEIHGQKAIDLLYIRKNNICHLDKFTLTCIADEWKSKFNELAKTKGNPWKK